MRIMGAFLKRFYGTGFKTMAWFNASLTLAFSRLAKSTKNTNNFHYFLFVNVSGTLFST